MSYKIVEKKDILELIKLSSYSVYKLCYIDEISETIFDYDEESRAYMSRPDYDPVKEQEKYGYYNPHLHMAEVPNPEYDPIEKTYYAYFTPIPLQDQWGDDWDDAPYEHNAGIPYDDLSQYGKFEIIKIPFGIKSTKVWVKLPSYYGNGNSPFSVEDINTGAVAWLYAASKRSGVCIYAGDTIKEFFKKLNKIESL